MLQNDNILNRYPRHNKRHQTEHRVVEELWQCDNEGESDGIGERTERNYQLNRNFSCMLDQSSETPLPSKNLNLVEDQDILIQNQFDIHSLAVKNILAISKEDIYGKDKIFEKDRKKVIYFSTDDISQKDISLISIVEDLNFEEALSKFSEESILMSTENIVTNSSTNLSSVSQKKSTNKSLNCFPNNYEGRSNIFFVCTSIKTCLKEECRS